jgi:hypothetical protein
MRAFFLLVLVLASALPAAAEGGPQPGSVALGAGAVYYVPGDGDGRWGPSALGRYYFNERVAAEGSLAYRNESYPGDLRAHTGAAQLSFLGLVGSGAFRLEPLVGVGYYGARVEGSDFHRNLGRFAVHAGAGVEFWPGKEGLWSLLASYRHVWLPDLDEGAGHFQRAGEQLDFDLVRRFGRLSR